MDSNGAGMSGLDEYDSPGQSAYDYENEIQDKIRKHEEKMARAFLNRMRKLEEQKANLQYQSQKINQRLGHANESDNHLEHETLQRYCQRQQKSQKSIKTKQ